MAEAQKEYDNDLDSNLPHSYAPHNVRPHSGVRYLTHGGLREGSLCCVLFHRNQSRDTDFFKLWHHPRQEMRLRIRQ